MIFGYLLLAHMLGDFVFQPGRLVAWKIRSKIGLAVHALVHFAITILLFVPFFIYGSYNNSFILAAAIVSVAHFFIDAAKIHYELSHDKKNISFIADQICHVIIIALVGYFFRDLIFYLPEYIHVSQPFFDSIFEAYYDRRLGPYWLIFFAIVVFITIGMEIYHFQALRIHNNNLKFKPRYGRILLRLIVFILIWYISMGYIAYNQIHI